MGDRTFESPHAEYLWQGAVLSGVVRGEGDADHPLGWFAPITLVDAPCMGADENGALSHYGTPYLILTERGADVAVLRFEEREQRDRRITEMQQALALHEAHVTEQEIVQAITGYRRALEWDAGHDGAGMSWDDAAQQRTGDDVTAFVVANVEDLRIYMATVDAEWQQVGADFAFTRLGSDVARQGGFARQAYGETVEDLVAAAERYPKVVVLVNEKQEMEVHDA